MAGGNPAAMSAIMGAVDSSLSVPRLGGSGGGIASILNAMRDRYGEERYKKELEQWRKDNDHDYDAEQASSLGQVSQQLQQVLNGKPEATNEEKYLGQILGTVGSAASQGGMGAVLPILQELMKDTGGAAADNTKMTDDEKEYMRNRQTGGDLAAFLSSSGQSSSPAAIQLQREYQRLMEAGDVESANRLLNFAHVTKDVNNVREAAAAGAQGKEQSEAIVDTFNKAPVAFQQYERIKSGFENTSQLIKQARDLLTQNPGAAGWTGITSQIPETDSLRMKNLLEAIKANVSLETLTNLKNASPTGASGFGALSEGELKVITDLLGTLDQTQTAGQLADTLNNVEQRLQSAAEGFHQSLSKDKSWFEANKHYAPDLYTRFRGSFDMLSPPQSAEAPVAPQAPQTPSPVQSFSATRQAISAGQSSQQAIEEEMRRRGMLPGVR